MNLKVSKARFIKIIKFIKDVKVLERLVSCTEELIAM